MNLHQVSYPYLAQNLPTICLASAPQSSPTPTVRETSLPVASPLSEFSSLRKPLLGVIVLINLGV
jgi:hypothetical protein